MTTPGIPPPHPAELAPVGTPIDTFAGMDDVDGGYGVRLRWARQRALAFRAEFASTGQPDLVDAYDLVSLSYPTRFGLWRAAATPAPFVRP